MVLSTEVLGPGKRAAIWMQGCCRECFGCMSPETRSLDGGKVVSVKSVADTIQRLDNIEGITISGGEPFIQRHSLYVLLKSIRENTELGVIIYTGYKVEELRLMNDPDIDKILGGLCDLIIDGEYVEELNDGRRFKGSSNQRLVFVTDRYKDCIDLYEEYNRSVEIVIKHNELFMYGIPDKSTLEKWMKYKENQGDKK